MIEAVFRQNAESAPQRLDICILSEIIMIRYMQEFCAIQISET
jgi:hypothetical protein